MLIKNTLLGADRSPGSVKPGVTTDMSCLILDLETMNPWYPMTTHVCRIICCGSVIKDSHLKALVHVVIMPKLEKAKERSCLTLSLHVDNGDSLLVFLTSVF